VWKSAFTAATAATGTVPKQHDGTNPHIMESHGDRNVTEL